MANAGRRDDRSREAQAWRRLYKTAGWRAIRAAQLAAEPLCRTCKAQGRITPATVCNHVDKRAKATVAGFFAGPFSSECQPCHDGVIQSDERRVEAGKLPWRACGSDGWPL